MRKENKSVNKWAASAWTAVDFAIIPAVNSQITKKRHKIEAIFNLFRPRSPSFFVSTRGISSSVFLLIEGKIVFTNAIERFECLKIVITVLRKYKGRTFKEQFTFLKKIYCVRIRDNQYFSYGHFGEIAKKWQFFRDYRYGWYSLTRGTTRNPVRTRIFKFSTRNPGRKNPARKNPTLWRALVKSTSLNW